MQSATMCQQFNCVFDKGTISDAAAHSIYAAGKVQHGVSGCWQWKGGWDFPPGPKPPKRLKQLQKILLDILGILDVLSLFLCVLDSTTTSENTSASEPAKTNRLCLKQLLLNLAPWLTPEEWSRRITAGHTMEKLEIFLTPVSVAEISQWFLFCSY